MAAAHIHPFQEERFLVTAGPITVRIGDHVETAQAAEMVIVPAGTLHARWNAGDNEIAAQVESRPALDTETFFETYFGLAEDGKVNAQGVPSPLQLIILGGAYRQEVRLPRLLSTIMGPHAFVPSPDRSSDGLPDTRGSSSV